MAVICDDPEAATTLLRQGLSVPPIPTQSRPCSMIPTTTGLAEIRIRYRTFVTNFRFSVDPDDASMPGARRFTAEMEAALKFLMRDLRRMEYVMRLCWHSTHCIKCDSHTWEEICSPCRIGDRGTRREVCVDCPGTTNLTTMKRQSVGDTVESKSLRPQNSRHHVRVERSRSRRRQKTKRSRSR